MRRLIRVKNTNGQRYQISHISINTVLYISYTHLYTSRDAWPNARLQARSEITILKRKRVLWESYDICRGCGMERCNGTILQASNRTMLSRSNSIVIAKVARDQAILLRKDCSFIFRKFIVIFYLLILNLVF